MQIDWVRASKGVSWKDRWWSVSRIPDIKMGGGRRTAVIYNDNAWERVAEVGWRTKILKSLSTMTKVILEKVQ